MNELWVQFYFPQPVLITTQPVELKKSFKSKMSRWQSEAHEKQHIMLQSKVIQEQVRNNVSV